MFFLLLVLFFSCINYQNPVVYSCKDLAISLFPLPLKQKHKEKYFLTAEILIQKVYQKRRKNAAQTTFTEVLAQNENILFSRKKKHSIFQGWSFCKKILCAIEIFSRHFYIPFPHVNHRLNLMNEVLCQDENVLSLQHFANIFYQVKEKWWFLGRPDNSASPNR